MKNTALPKLFVLILAAPAIVSCKQDKTTVPLSWRNPSFEQMVFKKLFIIGVGRDDGARRLFEDTFAKAIAARGASAQASWGSLPQSEQMSEEQIRAAIDGGNFDGVLVTRLLGVDQDQEYVPPSTHPVPTSYYGYGYYGYYGTSYATVHQPGYFKTNTTFRLETNLFHVASGDLVWSGQSQTVNPDSLKEVIESMTAAIAKKLKAEKLL